MTSGARHRLTVAAEPFFAIRPAAATRVAPEEARGRAEGTELYKLGADGSVTKWTDINSASVGLDPADMTQFAGALWFDGISPTKGRELFKLGADGSVTLWTDINSGGGGLDPQNMTEFAGALWFTGTSPTQGQELYKLGVDGRVTLWADINPGAGNSSPV